MIYTIGYGPNYDLNIGKKSFQKLGKGIARGKPYAGGSVWPSREIAMEYLEKNQPRLENYKVYGVDADWELDTEQLPNEPFRRLIKTSLLIKV